MNETLLQPLQNALSAFLSFLPQLVGAIIILIIGYIVAKILQAVVGRVLQGIGFDGWMERGGIKQFFDRAQTSYTPATVIGRLVFWFVFIIALTMAADALGIPQVSAVLGQLIAYIPSIIAAILILILAALLANFVSGIVRGRPAVISWRAWGRDHRLRGLRRRNRAGDRGGADGADVPDPARRGGFGGGDSVRDRRPGGGPGHPPEGLRPEQRGDGRLFKRR